MSDERPKVPLIKLAPNLTLHGGAQNDVTDGFIRVIGETIVEKVNWFGETSITRTFWDGEKLVTESVNPDDFYANSPPSGT